MGIPEGENRENRGKEIIKEVTRKLPDLTATSYRWQEKANLKAYHLRFQNSREMRRSLNFQRRKTQHVLGPENQSGSSPVNCNTRR